MSNVLGDNKQQQVVALGRLGWSLRRIEQATTVRRETASAYLKAAGIPVRERGGRPGVWPPKPATTPEVSTDSGATKPATAPAVCTDSGVSKPAIPEEVSTDPTPPSPPGRAPSASACEPYRELIAEALGRGRNARAIWQDLVDDHGFAARYASVRRFVVMLRGRTPAEARVVITTAPGEDYGETGVMLSVLAIDDDPSMLPSVSRAGLHIIPIGIRARRGGRWEDGPPSPLDAWAIRPGSVPRVSSSDRSGCRPPSTSRRRGPAHP
jgi:hypothetical protein